MSRTCSLTKTTNAETEKEYTERHTDHLDKGRGKMNQSGETFEKEVEINEKFDVGKLRDSEANANKCI
jgi:hypothetical protein